MSIKKKRGVVVFLDALGVSKYTQIDQFLKFCKDLEDLKKETNYIWAQWKSKFEKDGILLPDPEIAFFQDSLIVCFPEPEKDAEGTLHNFFAAQNWLMQALVMATAKKLFLRGAISNGDYIFTESTRSVAVLGTPVVDASYYEKWGDWIGVIQTPTFQWHYLAALKDYEKGNGKSLEESIQYHSKFYVKYEVPLKTGNIHECFVVNWPTLTKKTGAKEVRASLMEGMESADPENKAKYGNTLIFLDFCEQNGYFIE